MFRIVLLVGLGILAAACAAKKPLEMANSRSGDVAVNILPAAMEETYQIAAPDEEYDHPRQFGDNALPGYPEALLEQRLPPLRVAVRVIVDEAGNVTGVSPLVAETLHDPAFFDAVRTAVTAWKFTPLVKMKKGPGKTEIIFQEVVATYAGQATALPFHQDYAFTFTQRDGKGFVSTEARGKAP